MSYVNFNTFHKYNLQPEDLYFLAAIKQIEKEQLKNIPIEVIQRVEALGILTTIKGSKSEAESLKTRLNDKGKEFFRELSEPEVEEQDKTVFNWLKKYYLDAGKSVGNGIRTQRHLRDFRLQTGIEKNNLIKLILSFLAENEDKSKMLEYILHFPKHAYDIKFNLDTSWLWNFYLQNKEHLDKQFEKTE
jgi:hypothetical protein